MSIQASRTVVGLVVVAIVAAVFWYMKEDTDYLGITSYEACVGAGYQASAVSPRQCTTPDGRTFTETVSATTTSGTNDTSPATSTSNGNENLIKVANVSANQKISSPLVVTGEARGNWYFEASFPVELRDGNGTLIAQKPAQAIGEWMTTNLVPFSVTLSFVKPTTATGTLILRNDNPSGLPENDRFISIPVRF